MTPNWKYHAPNTRSSGRSLWYAEGVGSVERSRKGWVARTPDGTTLKCGPLHDGHVWVPAAPVRHFRTAKVAMSALERNPS